MRKVFSIPLLKFISVCIVSVVLAAFLGLAIVNALVVESQKNVNILQEERDELTQENRNLQTQEASVKSAEVVVKAARERGMIDSPAIEYIPKSDVSGEN